MVKCCVFLYRGFSEGMDIKKIVTHPGGAHKDDFLACSVMIFYHKVPIFRREPCAKDLEDPSVCVIDVGGEHNPLKHNFDHHQFPRDFVPTCALSLVLKHFHLYDDARKFCDWLEPAEWFDTRGAVKTANWLNVDREVMAKLNSPLDITCLRRFAKHTELKPGDTIWELMRMVGEDLVYYISSAKERLDYISENAEVLDLGGNLKVLFMPRTEPMPGEPSAGMGKFIELDKSASNCVAMVYPDRRGEGYALCRYNDDLRLEFTRLNYLPDVHFAHVAGFMAKTTATEKDRLIELLKVAWIG